MLGEAVAQGVAPAAEGGDAAVGERFGQGAAEAGGAGAAVGERGARRDDEGAAPVAEPEVEVERAVPALHGEADRVAFGAGGDGAGTGREPHLERRRRGELDVDDVETALVVPGAGEGQELRWIGVDRDRLEAIVRSALGDPSATRQEDQRETRRPPGRPCVRRAVASVSSTRPPDGGFPDLALPVALVRVAWCIERGWTSVSALRGPSSSSPGSGERSRRRGRRTDSG